VDPNHFHFIAGDSEQIAVDHDELAGLSVLGVGWQGQRAKDEEQAE
jgi:hypothetical protein